MKQLPEFTVVERAMVPHILKGPLRSQVKWLVSIGNDQSKLPAGFDKMSPASRLRLVFDDVTYNRPWGGYVPPMPDDIARLIQFAERAKSGNVLLHCAAGVSRSSASALIMLAMRHGAGNEQEAIDQLLADTKLATQLRLRDHEMITPNRRMVWLADQQLGRDGALYDALIMTFGFMYSTSYEPGVE